MKIWWTGLSNETEMSWNEFNCNGYTLLINNENGNYIESFLLGMHLWFVDGMCHCDKYVKVMKIGMLRLHVTSNDYGYCYSLTLVMFWVPMCHVLANNMSN